MIHFIGCGWSSGRWITITDYSDYYKIKNMCKLLLTGEKPEGQCILKHHLRPGSPELQNKIIVNKLTASNTNAINGVSHRSALFPSPNPIWYLLAESHFFHVTEKFILEDGFPSTRLSSGFQMDAYLLQPLQRKSLPHILKWNCLITSLWKSPNELFGQPILAISTFSVIYNFLLTPSPLIWSL